MTLTLVAAADGVHRNGKHIFGLFENDLRVNVQAGTQGTSVGVTAVIVQRDGDGIIGRAVGGGALNADFCDFSDIGVAGFGIGGHLNLLAECQRIDIQLIDVHFEFQAGKVKDFGNGVSVARGADLFAFFVVLFYDRSGNRRGNFVVVERVAGIL